MDQQEIYEQAEINRTRFLEMKRVPKHLHDMGIDLVETFEERVDDWTKAAFWTRENVVNAINAKDVQLMCHWLRVAIKKAEGW